ncbi:MAG: purine-nucleoside phosphorylase, partial [Fimbriimonadaceae bacterium]
VNGPRYETPAEIRMMRTLGADLVGMTVSSEAVVMREAGIDYGCLAIVSNPAVGTTEEELDHEAVTAAVEAVADDAVKILAQAALAHQPAT